MSYFFFLKILLNGDILRRAKLFFINGIILTSTSLLLRGIGLIFNIYVANQVGSETLGIFSLIMSIYMFAITVATSGIGTACTCLVSEEFEKGNYINGLKVVKTCIIFALILGILASILIIVFAPFISHYWLNNSVSPRPIYAIALGLPLISISSVIGGYFSSVGKSYKSAISQILETTAKIIATIILLHFNLEKGIEAICISLIVADVISEVFSFSLNIIFYLIDRRKYINKRSLPIQMKRKIFKISFPIAITSCIKSGLSSLKQFLIPIRLSMSGLTYAMSVSQYGLISGMVMPILMFANVFIISFSGLLVPEFSRLLAGKNYNRMNIVCNTIFRNTCLFSICIAGIIFFFANELSLIIYENIEISKWLRILSPLVFFIYIDNIIDNILKGINEQVGVMFCNIIDLVITILIIYFIVPKFGMSGYILSIFVSELVNFAISSFQLRKRIKYSFNIFEYIIIPVLGCIISYIICSLFAFNFLPFLNGLIGKVLIFILVYFVFMKFACKTKKL